MLCHAHARGQAGDVLSSIAEVNRVLQTPTENIMRRMVFRGVVIHWANSPRGAYIQRDGAGVFVRYPREMTLPALGDEIEVTAGAKFVSPGPDTEIDVLSSRVIGHPGLPEPIRCSLFETNTGKYNRLAVEVEGDVLHTSRLYGFQWLMLADKSGTAMAGIYSWPAGWKGSDLVGKRVRLRGVAAGIWHQALRCSTPGEISILGNAGDGDAVKPLKTIEETLAYKPGAAQLQPALLRGSCISADPAQKQFKLQSGTATLDIRMPIFDPSARLPKVGEEMEVSGVAATDGGRVWVNAWTLASYGSAQSPGVKAQSPEFSGVRKTVSEVLAAPISSQRLVISGTVQIACSSGPMAFMVVRDATGSAFVYAPETPMGFNGLTPSMPKPGDRVEVEGVRTTLRAQSPQLYEATWKVIGHESLPEPPLITFADTTSLDYDGRLVRIRGRMVDYETFQERGQTISRIWIRSENVATYGNFIGTEYAPAPAQVGQLVELRGVFNAGRVAPNVVRTFAVYLQGMSDARALPEPSVWQDPAARRWIIAVALVLVAACAWVFFLRRQVRLRTAKLAARETELQRALEREQELGNLKTAFISMVSHEFRTPLNVIVTSSDILARYMERLPAEERAEHLSSIQKSIKRMAGMMEDVLLLGRFDAGQQKLQPAEIHLPAWCHRFTDEMHSATGGRCPIELKLSEFEPIVRADESVLRHILANLLSNAVKYSRPGEAVNIGVEREGVDAVFRIVDHGIGIPVEDQKLLFEAFQRGGNVAHISGTGLGLVVVKRGVELHGGTIDFVSKEGEGSTFTVRLPVFEETTNSQSQ